MPSRYAAKATGASVRDWHVGPVFAGSLGYHQYVVEFLVPPSDPRRFRDLLDEDLSRRNADYQAHRIPGVGLPPPALRVARPGVFEGWMRRRGKLGGQNKVPRVDNSGTLTRDLLEYLDETSSPDGHRSRQPSSPIPEERSRSRSADGAERSRSGRALLLLVHQVSDLGDRIEVLHARLESLDGDRELLFEEDDQFQSADRVEDASGDQGSAGRELVRDPRPGGILAR